MTAANLRTYETICITKVDMPEDKFNALVERCKSAVTQEGKGEWLYSDDWGRAKIAFTIGKDNRGRWTYMRYRSAAEGLNEVNRTLGINEFVLRQITTRASEDGKDYESIRANMPQDLVDRERMRDWKEERQARRGGYGHGGYRPRDAYEASGVATPSAEAGAEDEAEDGSGASGADMA